jgi:hypothetical protein
MTQGTHYDAVKKACPIMSDSSGCRTCLGIQCMAWAPDETDDSDRLHGHCHLTQPAPK